MPKLITMGETMAAFSPGAMGPLRYVPDYRLRIAGAESNLAIGICKLGQEASWISRIGDDEFGHYLRNMIRAEGVDTRCVTVDERHRTGVMFKQTSSGETKVYYYRENSAASFLCAKDLSPAYFEEADILHLTGITPVLSESCREACQRAIALAQEYGLLFSFDPNIRKKLWGQTDFAPLIREMTLCAQIVLLGLDEAGVLFSTTEPDEIFDTLFETGRATYVAIKDGANGAWAADKNTRHRLPPHPCKPVEPIGAGDAFNAGFLAGLLEGRDVLTCGKMGSIAGALATQTLGDIEGYPSRAQMRAHLASQSETYR